MASCYKKTSHVVLLLKGKSYLIKTWDVELTNMLDTAVHNEQS